MRVVFYNNTSDNMVVDKKITMVKEMDAHYYEESGILSPTLILAYDSSYINSNYVYIPYFARFYYISDIVAVDGGRMRISCNVDVLKTYSEKIKALTCIVDKQKSSLISNKYRDDGSYVITNKIGNNIIEFPQGFLDDGQFILITAGGN